MDPHPTLLLCGPESHPLYPSLLAAAERAAASGAALERAEIQGLPGEPALVLSCDGRRNIRYLAAPDGPEEAPFREALARFAQPDAPVADWQMRVAALDVPADVRVYVAAGCPHCPHAVRAALEASLASPLVTTTVIDAFQFPELAERHRVGSVPMTLIDGGLSITGQLTAEELATHLLSRGDAAYGARALLSLIEAGSFEDAAASLIAGPGVAHFLLAWRRSSLSSRMGLMLLVEQVLEKSPGALDGVVVDLAALAQSSPDADEALRGDTADLLGKIGHPDAIPALEALRDDPHPDIAEIATDALAEMRGT